MGIKENIKMLRKEHHLSQKEFASFIGASDKAVSTWEIGIRIPRMGAIQRIADRFGLQKSDLIEDHPDNFRFGTKAERLQCSASDNEKLVPKSKPDDMDAQLLLDAITQLSPDDFRLVVSLVLRLLSRR